MADLNEGRLDRPRSRARFIAFGMAAVVIFTALAGRLVQLQVIDGSTYAARAQAVTTMQVPIPAARGLIFDRAGRPLAINVPSWTVKARKADLPGERTGIVLGEVARVTGVDPRELRRRLDAFTGSRTTSSRSRAGSTATRPSCSESGATSSRESWSRPSRCGSTSTSTARSTGR